MLTAAVTGALLVGHAAADCYMHNPRGSNNRLNEQNANRNNGNRLFDSQNNNRGGYNVGDKTDDAFTPGDTGGGTAGKIAGFRGINTDQYNMVYFAGSELNLEWTVQHGCGGSEENDPHKLNCNMVIQLGCNTKDVGTDGVDRELYMQLKDGRNTNQPNELNAYDDATTKDNNDAQGRGRHESEGWYYYCKNSARNKGLFLADQKLKGETSIYTRQNPNGNRRGLECAEERDYYPYWKPTPWMDVAMLTDHVDQDCAMVTANSMNNNPVGKCTYAGAVDADRKLAWAALNETECAASPGTWQTFTHGMAAPDCTTATWSRVNHLGNNRDGYGNGYKTTIPSLAQLSSYTHIANGLAKCAFRLRYNISTDDYDVRNTNSSQNENKNKGIISPIENNPTINLGGTAGRELAGLRLAINTNQFGRTFQDRSHAFFIRPAPTLPTGACTNWKNLNVRGKRGNIVQTFPAVEYDFYPGAPVPVGKDATSDNNHCLDPVAVNDCVHIQWTGSNTHNNGNPAGDGQAGDAGEGTGGTDRHNMVSILNYGTNYPIPMDTQTAGNFQDQDLFDAEHVECYCPDFDESLTAAVQDMNYIKDTAYIPLSAKDCVIRLASGGYYLNGSPSEVDTKPALNVLLNNAPASLAGGCILKFKTGAAGKQFTYMSTRNNNFSNRSQKGVFCVLGASAQ